LLWRSDGGGEKVSRQENQQMQTSNKTKVREEVKREENEVKEEAKQIDKVMDEPTTPEIWRWANGRPQLMSLMSGSFRTPPKHHLPRLASWRNQPRKSCLLSLAI
jgi:hypothetical protein